MADTTTTDDTAEAIVRALADVDHYDEDGDCLMCGSSDEMPCDADCLFGRADRWIHARPEPSR